VNFRSHVLSDGSGYLSGPAVAIESHFRWVI
jgi:hypothetical protein